MGSKRLITGVLAAVAVTGALRAESLMDRPYDDWTQSVDTAVVLPAGERPQFLFDPEIIANFSTGDQFAPYYIVSNAGALTTNANGIAAYLHAERPLERRDRLEYGYGVGVLAGYHNQLDYSRYNPQTKDFFINPTNHGTLSLRELWAGIKWRSLFLYAGMKPEERSLFNQRLGVGDLVMSDNARPVPQVRAGFIDFQDIPFTRGWVQIQGEVAWGKFSDNGWLEDRFNYYNSFYTTGVWMHYSRCYFRTNPRMPFYVTVGMQQATQFGGTWHQWRDGHEYASHHTDVRFKDFINALFPWTGGSSDSEGDQAYYSGNHLGSWDLMLTYRFRNGSTLKGYMQSPWEDGSGIGKLNGWDGVWGLEYSFAPGTPIIKTVLAEYVDLTNQSGPMHWAPGDFPGTQVTGQATGADDYYNNYMYNGWANYGRSIGTPFVKGTMYNRDGYLRFTDNRVRGFQLGAEGSVGQLLDWRALFSYRTSWGTPLLPSLEKRHDTSMLLEAAHNVHAVKGLRVGLQIAWDAGNLYEGQFGALLKVRYTLPVKF